MSLGLDNVRLGVLAGREHLHTFMSLGYSVFVFTDEGDCMVIEMFGFCQVDRLV